MNSIAKKIEERIESLGRGKVFFIGDFADLGNAEVVRQTLNRLVKGGMIIRCGRGVYCYPEFVPEDKRWLLGSDAKYIIPSMDTIAKAIARRDDCRIAPTADHALNWLGLSTQVPANMVYLTDGSPRRVPIGGGKGILFVHTSDMNHFAFRSELMQLIVLAMKEIGERAWDEERKNIVKEHLQKVAREDFEADVKLAPTWVGAEMLKMYEVL